MAMTRGGPRSRGRCARLRGLDVRAPMSRGWIVRRALVGFLGLACLGCASAPRARPEAVDRAAARYSAESSGPAAFAGKRASSELRDLLQSRAAALGLALQPDARLGAVAQFLLSTRAEQGELALWTELVARRLGVYDGVLSPFRVPVEHDEVSTLSALFSEQLAKHPYTHFGVALAERAGKRVLSVVLAARQLALEPVPRTIAKARPLSLRGRLPRDVSDARIELLQSGAALVVLPLGPNRNFSLQLPAARPGLQRVEIVAERRTQRVVLAALPVYVGMAPPARIELPAARLEYDVAVIRARMLARLNAQRRAAGLPALRRDPRLDAVAQAHCRDMREHGFVGHVSTDQHDPAARLRRAGLSAGLVLETLDRATDVRALEAGSAADSDERRHRLAREVTDVGIGVITLPDAFGGTLLTTEVYARLPGNVDVAEATPRLLSELNHARVQRGGRPLALDPGLSDIATRAATRFISDPGMTEQATIAAAQSELGKFALAYRRVDAMLTLTNAIDDAATLEPALDERAAGLGIGIAEGKRPERGSVVAVVLIVGLRR